jgi:hypothetical protein
MRGSCETRLIRLRQIGRHYQQRIRTKIERRSNPKLVGVRQTQALLDERKAGTGAHRRAGQDQGVETRKKVSLKVFA